MRLLRLGPGPVCVRNTMDYFFELQITAYSKQARFSAQGERVFSSVAEDARRLLVRGLC